MSAYVTEVRAGETLLHSLYRNGLYLEAACGGHGRCRRCRVRIDRGPVRDVGPEDAEMLTEEEAKARWRLACRVSSPGEYAVTPAHPVDLAAVELPDLPPTGRRLGLGVDLGTTTVAAALVDLDSAELLARAARRNAQAAYGEDVLSRVQFGRSPEHRPRLADLARQVVGSLLAELLGDAGLSPGDVRRAALAGNASMEMLFLGRDPKSLAVAPHEPGLREEGPVTLPADALPLPEGATARFLPALGGHVGGDTTAAILASGLLTGPQPALLVDLGTNGEVVLATKEGALTASGAAGPAFEGGGIEHGSPAQPGAVEHVGVEDGRPVLSVIGGGEPRSWCGSGVIEVTAALRRLGDIDESGRMAKERDDLPVAFTQSDVREVQLAKSAVAAAEKLLCRTAGIRPEELRRVVLTGAFGSHLRAGPAREIGLVPPGVPVELLENGALAGAVLALEEGGFDRAERAAKRVRHVSLAGRMDFQETFVQCMALREMEP